MLTGMFIITLFDVYMDRSMILKLRVVLVLILALSIFNDLETYTGNLEHFTYWRLIFSVICYSLRPTIIMMLIYLVSPKTSKLMIIPAVINFLVSASAFFTDIPFTFDMENNHFIRGPLGYTPYVMTVIYILTLYYITVRTLTGRFSEEGIVIFFITLAATISTVLAFYGHDEVVDLTFASEVMLYYMYLYAQYTKRDPLTSVFNRQTMGRHLSSRMIIRTFIGTGISALIMLPFHQFGQGEITEGTSQIGKIIELVFSIFPGDLITPFVEGNMLQIIFSAVMVGVVMLILGDKVDKSEKLIDLSKITVPTLVICGSNDPYLNFELVNNSIKALPEGSELEIIEGGAHVIMYEKPYYKEFQNKLSEFLVK